MRIITLMEDPKVIRRILAHCLHVGSSGMVAIST